MESRRLLFICTVVLFGDSGGGLAVHAAQPASGQSAKGLAFFETKIRPVLARHCRGCHSQQSGKAEGELRLDTRAGIRGGGSRGPAVVPGDPKRSLLLTAISHDDPDLTMPPDKPRLSASIRADFSAWIKMGAPDPRSGGKVLIRPPTDLESGRGFWAMIKPVAPPLPTTKNTSWAVRDLDHFVLAKLESAGLQPSLDAEPAVFLRRLHYDLIGLPPTPKRVADFQSTIQKEGLQAAIKREADVLLSSPRYGERWGRHWLDVARFAESSGGETNVTFPHAWRYRNYVID
ncbi:MAG: DUF1549 domain-containing protein, partial [Planctomycetales bacterium]